MLGLIHRQINPLLNIIVAQNRPYVATTGSINFFLLGIKQYLESKVNNISEINVIPGEQGNCI
jgi:hypothetical protein